VQSGVQGARNRGVRWGVGALVVSSGATSRGFLVVDDCGTAGPGLSLDRVAAITAGSLRPVFDRAMLGGDGWALSEGRAVDGASTLPWTHNPLVWAQRHAQSCVVAEQSGLTTTRHTSACPTCPELHNTIQHSTTQHTTARHNAHSTTQHTTAHHSTQHRTAQHSKAHNTEQHNTTHHSTTHHSTAQRNSAQHCARPYNRLPTYQTKPIGSTNASVAQYSEPPACTAIVLWCCASLTKNISWYWVSKFTMFATSCRSPSNAPSGTGSQQILSTTRRFKIFTTV